MATGEDLTTLDGEKYSGEITRIEPDGIVMTTGDGIEKINFKDLSEPVQKKYNYDPAKAAAFSQQVTKARHDSNARTQAILKQQEATERAVAQDADKKEVKKVVAEPNTGLIVRTGKMTVDEIAEKPFSLRGCAVEVTGISEVKKQEVAEGGFKVTMWGSDKWLVAEMTIDQYNAVANMRHQQLFIRVKDAESYSSAVPVEVLGNAVTYQGLSNQPSFYWK